MQKEANVVKIIKIVLTANSGLALNCWPHYQSIRRDKLSVQVLIAKTKNVHTPFSSWVCTNITQTFSLVTGKSAATNRSFHWLVSLVGPAATQGESRAYTTKTQALDHQKEEVLWPWVERTQQNADEQRRCNRHQNWSRASRQNWAQQLPSKQDLTGLSSNTNRGQTDDREYSTEMINCLLVCLHIYISIAIYISIHPSFI